MRLPGRRGSLAFQCPSDIKLGHGSGVLRPFISLSRLACNQERLNYVSQRRSPRSPVLTRTGRLFAGDLRASISCKAASTTRTDWLHFSGFLTETNDD